MYLSWRGMSLINTQVTNDTWQAVNKKDESRGAREGRAARTEGWETPPKVVRAPLLKAEEPEFSPKKDDKKEEE